MRRILYTVIYCIRRNRLPVSEEYGQVNRSKGSNEKSNSFIPLFLYSFSSFVNHPTRLVDTTWFLPNISLLSLTFRDNDTRNETRSGWRSWFENEVEIRVKSIVRGRRLRRYTILTCSAFCSCHYTILLSQEIRSSAPEKRTNDSSTTGVKRTVKLIGCVGCDSKEEINLPVHPWNEDKSETARKSKDLDIIRAHTFENFGDIGITRVYETRTRRSLR